MHVAGDPADPSSISHRLLESVLECLDAGIAVTDAQGIIVCTNRYWEDYRGENPLLAGCGVGSDYLGVCNQVIKGPSGDLSIVALGIRSVLTGKVPHLNLDYPHRGPAGTVWYGMAGDQATSPGLGAVIRQSDTTRQMTMGQRLHRSESLFQLTTENTRDLVAIISINGVARYRSPSYRRTLGYSDAELAALAPFDLLHPEDLERFQGALRQGARKGLSGLFEFRARHRDGSYVQLEGQAAAVETGGDELEAVLLTARDITERKAAEQERAQMEIQLRHGQKMEAVGQLAAGVAHEINTPTQFVGDNLRFLEESFASLVALVQGASRLAELASGQEATAAAATAWLQQMEQEDLAYLTDEVPRALRQSLDGVARVSTIVKAMKVFTHPSGEGMAAVNLNEAIENTLIVSRSEWKYCCEVERDFAPDLPALVCNPGELNQVILNLVVNAAHAIATRLEGDPGALGLIRIATRAVDHCAEVRVSDDGCGIPPHQVEQIWLPFFTTKPVGKGTGQGLSIVHSIIARHRGSIAVASEVGRGSTFTVRIPLQPAEAGEVPRSN